MSDMSDMSGMAGMWYISFKRIRKRLKDIFLS